MPREKAPKRLSTVTKFNALLGRQLCECQPKLREQEQRIVSKTARAAWLVQNDPFGAITKRLDDPSIACCRNHAHEAGTATVV